MDRQRLPARDPFQTRGFGGTDRVVPVKPVAARGWDRPAGAVIHTTNRHNANPATERGGFEWTGAGRPLRIPTVVKEWYARLVQRIGDWMDKPVSRN